MPLGHLLAGNYLRVVRWAFDKHLVPFPHFSRWVFLDGLGVLASGCEEVILFWGDSDDRENSSLSFLLSAGSKYIII